MRFSKSVKNLITGLYVVNVLLMLPVTLFIPALALAQVTHLNLHLINAVCVSICVVYTTLVGLHNVPNECWHPFLTHECLAGRYQGCGVDGCGSSVRDAGIDRLVGVHGCASSGWGPTGLGHSREWQTIRVLRVSTMTGHHFCSLTTFFQHDTGPDYPADILESLLRLPDHVGQLHWPQPELHSAYCLCPNGEARPKVTFLNASSLCLLFSSVLFPPLQSHVGLSGRVLRHHRTKHAPGPGHVLQVRRV